MVREERQGRRGRQRGVAGSSEQRGTAGSPERGGRVTTSALHGAHTRADRGVRCVVTRHKPCPTGLYAWRAAPPPRLVDAYDLRLFVKCSRCSSVYCRWNCTGRREAALGETAQCAPFRN